MTADHHWRQIGRTARERAGHLLAALTFDEKVALALGDFEAVAHLGIPALRYADGPNGIRGPDNVTAFPASLALAATFDEGLAAAYGAAVAEEVRDTGSNVLLGPAVDIARVPLGGRLPEALGEDPYLAGRLAAAEVRAIQDGHVIAMVKHFIAPDFMHAVRDPVAAANAGLDIPGLAVTEGRTAEDFTSGRIPAERLDEIVRRTLFAIFDAGLDQHPLPDRSRRPALASTPEHVALATRIATDGMVLLANRDRLLPLYAGGIGSVAVLGTARDDAQWVMAGSPCVRVSPDRRVTPLEGITTRAGADVRVAFAQGSFGDAPLPLVPAEVLTPPDEDGNGLLGEYWNGETPDGEPALTVVDPTVNLSQAPEGLTGRVFSARWTGTITPAVDGPHRFTVLAAGIIRLQIDGALVAVGEREFGQVFDGPPLPVSGVADLRAGRPVRIRLDYSSSTAWPVLEPGVSGGNLQQDEATGAVTVSLQITNVGGRTGAEVVQLYLAAPAAAQQPPRQLKGFAKVHLDPGATSEVSLRLDRDDLAAFDEATGAWILHDGRYEVLVGHSSRDLRGRAQFEVGTKTLVRP